ncbi:MAG TPA: DUF6328 family protein [Mycobacterium sp.]|nr:DUF6328 family protein [Mycobacterium sp.]
MDIDHPERDQRWDDAARSETPTERLDRNWSNLLQELRVTQTGVQLLTGFLLTLPFQQRFDRLDGSMRAMYVATVAFSIAATIALVAPVAAHRLLFRQRRLKVLVSAAHRMAMAGLALLGIALAGVTVVVVDMVYGRGAAFIGGAIALLGFVSLWVVLPLILRTKDRDDGRPAVTGASRTLDRRVS